MSKMEMDLTIDMEMTGPAVIVVTGAKFDE